MLGGDEGCPVPVPVLPVGPMLGETLGSQEGTVGYQVPVVQKDGR
jgi:hypothetical protein